MSQSSLLAWLQKPKAVVEPPSPAKATATDSTADQEKSASIPANAALPPDVGGEPLWKNAQPTLPQNVELRPCSKDDIPNLKRLTGLLLPIPYPERFYREILEDPLTNNITLLAVWHDDPAMKSVQKGRLVGAIRCRLLTGLPLREGQRAHDKSPMLYLSTLALLSPYRHYGIATQLLSSVMRRAIDDYGITSVGAHVWVANEDGLKWYRKRGFHEVGRESGYYRRLDPQDAVVMQRTTSVMDLVTEQCRARGTPGTKARPD